MLDYSIEFSHIYLDEQFGREQEKSIEICKNYFSKLKSKKFSFSSCVLVDDYNSKSRVMITNDLFNNFKKRKIDPDFVVFESELASKKEVVLKGISSLKLKKYYENYIQNKNHVPCSLLCAVWYLVRLGVIEMENDKFYKSNKNSCIKATKIINILSRKYEIPENKAIEIIENSIYKNYLKKIETIFY